MLVAAWSSGAAELLTKEGARRRLRIELDRECRRPVTARGGMTRFGSCGNGPRWRFGTCRGASESMG